MHNLEGYILERCQICGHDMEDIHLEAVDGKELKQWTARCACH